MSLAGGVPESRRYELPHAERAPLPGRRFLLLAASAFLYNLLIAPTTFYENRYLKDVRGYSATLIAVFTLVTGTPGAIGVLVGGRLADVKGRRAGRHDGPDRRRRRQRHGLLVARAPGCGAAKLVTTILAGMAVPALGVYAAELFPTSRRGRRQRLDLGPVDRRLGRRAAAGRASSSTRARPTGRWWRSSPSGRSSTPRWSSFAYPETARRTLDDINPEDRTAV